jgi:hypothetical protein
MLSKANLLTLHNHVIAIEVDVCIKVLKILMKCRREDKRVAPIYEVEFKKSLEMCALFVESCDRIDATESKYEVKCRDGTAVMVDLDTKIVHRGQVFIIPTCSCGYWCSSFRLCMHIMKALIEDGQGTWKVKNIHPVHLVQLHPLWPDAIRKCKMEDYNDLQQIKLILSDALVEKIEPTAAAAAACPDEFYEYKGKKNVPKSLKVRAGKIQEAANKLLKVSVELGDENTFKLALAHLNRATKECMDMNGTTNNAAAYNEVLPLPPAARVGKKSEHVKADGTNHSRLSASSSSSAAKPKKGQKKKPNNTQQQCPQCHVLVAHAKINLNTNHTVDNCPNLELFRQHFMAKGKSEDGAEDDV